MSNPWIEEAWRALIIALISLLVGWLIGHMALALLLGLGAYAGWHMRQVYRLERWLRHGKHFHPPEANGIWEEIFQQIEAQGGVVAAVEAGWIQRQISESASRFQAEAESGRRTIVGVNA